MLTLRKDRDEGGAVAVLVAVMTLLLFGIGAIAVDLGNAFSRKRDVQSQADFAALAGGGSLPGSKSASDPAVLAVVAYLNANQPQDDGGGSCVAAGTCVTAGQLVDGSDANGEVYFTNGEQMRVVTPTAQVDFGLAGALGAQSVDVIAAAEVGIFSPGVGVMPAYAVTGCDYGRQTLTDPANGHVNDPISVPTTLAAPDDTNDADLTAVTAPSPPQVTPQDPPAPGPALTVTGDKFQPNGANARTLKQVGFFHEDGRAPVAVDVEESSFNDDQFTIGAIPAAVAGEEALWWIRVWKEKDDGSDGSWSPLDEALPLRVGTAVLECGAGSNSGNFGVLRLPRTNPNNNSLWLPANIASSLDPPLTLKVFPSPAPGKCREGSSWTAPGSIWSGDPHPGLMPNTNCVDTDPGLPAGDATAGLISGVTTDMPGRLDVDTTPGCAPDGGADRWTTPVARNPGSGHYSINDDILTCFLNDQVLDEIQDSTGQVVNLGMVASPTYALPRPVFDKEIYSSPRFFWIPVVDVEPASGSSDHYAIVDFRPAFITGQPLSATKANPDVDGVHSTSDTRNGLRFSTGGGQTQVVSLKIVFLNIAALPNDADGQPVGPYLGVGPKIVRLID